MVKKEKYVDWLSVPLPEIYVEQVRDFIKATKTCSSVAEYVRKAIDNQLSSDLERFKNFKKNEDKWRGN